VSRFLAINIEGKIGQLTVRRTSSFIILSYLLLFSLLIVCGDIELNPGPQGTPVSHENTLSKSAK
jgi:hypothetical protein